MSSDRDQQSWRSWLDRHGPALRLFARQYCQSHADAEDAVQDGFVRFWKTRGRASDVTAYLFACVRSAAMDFSRGQRRRTRHEADAMPSSATGEMFDALEREEFARSVESALAGLSPEQREVVVLKIWGELTFAQIGDALAINPETAASRYRYGLGRLQTTLRQETAS